MAILSVAASASSVSGSRRRLRVGAGSLCLVLAAVLCAATMPTSAAASTADVEQKWTAAVNDMVFEDGYDAYAYEGTAAPVALSDSNVSAAGLPQSYSLAKLGFVTKAKKQAPWGDCWCFATVAAAESSILSKAAQNGVDVGDLDLSERALINFVYSKNGVPASVAGSTQAGEGTYGAANSGYFDAGGKVSYCMTLFSAGIGLVPESQAPYKNNEAVIVCEVTPEGASEVQTKYWTQSEIDAYAAEHPADKIVRKSWAGPVRDDDGAVVKYYDWSIDDSLWDVKGYALNDANVLPAVRVEATESTPELTDANTVVAMKKELMAGHGIATAYHLDESNSDSNKVSKFFDRNTWSHYTWSDDTSNHYVTIVGWDDTYSKGNFKNNAGKTPEGDGAWLVKQSSGSEEDESDFQNTGAWGILDENGKHTGYFWLSYYDRSIRKCYSFDFDLTNYGGSGLSYTDQYDYLPQEDVIVASSKTPVSSANVFTAQGDMALRTLACATYKQNTTVTYQVYLLDSEAATPTDPEHAKLVCTAEGTYAYGGYHRVTLDEGDWVAMRKGQRYAVVTTQRCDDNGLWYQGAAMNNGRRISVRAKLNAGESWTGTTAGSVSEATSATSWTDWTAVAAGVHGTDFSGEWAVDNASIKGISEARSWASVEELAKLKQALAQARAKLDAAKTSIDGSDVASSATWITQAEREDLEAKIAAAERLLARAGDFEDALANTTPSSDEVIASIASVAFDAAQGSKTESPKADASAKKDEAQAPEGKGSRGQTKSSIPATGDAVNIQMAAALIAGAFALIAAAVINRSARRS